jgi:hypothetical protein
MSDKYQSAFGDEPSVKPRVPTNDETYREEEKISLPRRDKQKLENMKALVREDDGTYKYKRFRLSPMGLTLPKDMTRDEYKDMGEILLSLDSALTWALGDWLAFGEDKQWGETYQQIAEEFGYDVDTLYDYSWVCRKVEISIRSRDLSFAHHRLIAPMEKENQLWWLQQASEQKPRPTVAQMRLAIKVWKNGGQLTSGEPPALISTERRSEFGKMLKVMAKANTGDKKAKQQSLGYIAELRQWCDQVERLLSSD